MHRSFRQSQFRRKGEVGEDVNPSAYIVNLADCMLVLACGFLVALISAFDMDLSSLEQVDATQMEEVDQQAISAEDIENGGGYIEAGTVYMDPQTGITYWIKNEDVASATEQESAGEQASAAKQEGAATQEDTAEQGSASSQESASETSSARNSSNTTGSEQS